MSRGKFLLELMGGLGLENPAPALGDPSPSPCWGHPRSCGVTWSGTSLLCQQPPPGQQGRCFPRSWGIPGAAGSSKGKGILSLSLLHTRASLLPFPRAEKARKGAGKVGKQPQLHRKRFGSPPAASPAGPAANSSSRKRGDPRDSHQSPCAPCPLPGGETEARRSRGRLCHNRSAAFPTFSPSRGEREAERLRSRGVRDGAASEPPFPAPQNNEGWWGLEEFGGFFLPGWSKSMDQSTWGSQWVKSDPSCHSRALWG